MYPLLGACPVCGEPMAVTRLHCRQCDTTIEGRFTLGRLAALSTEQLSFVEMFVRCEGKIKRVEKELGVSYPTVRSRLDEIIRAMGYEVIGDYEGQQLSPEERRHILEQLNQGDLTTSEALALLQGDEYSDE